MGTDGGSYGRTKGTVLSAAASSTGNGPRVRVTAHPASAPAAEWRVLRFGDTRQSVALVDEHGCGRDSGREGGRRGNNTRGAPLDAPPLPPASLTRAPSRSSTSNPSSPSPWPC